MAADISKMWMPLGRELGLPDNILDRIELDFNSTYERCYQMFRKWKQTKVNSANYGALADALRHPAVSRDDLVSKYC